MNTLATVFEVWVPTVTLLAITTVSRPIVTNRTCGVSLHIYNSLCTEQLYMSRYQLPNQKPWKGTLSLHCRLIRWSEENWNLSFRITKAKLHAFLCVFIEAICCQGNILHSFWNINLATPNPRARPVHYIASVLTDKHATNAINEPN